MTLKEWLSRHKMSDAAFARLSGIGQRALVQKYRHGRQLPAPENLRRIKKATEGAVTADDFLDQYVGGSSPCSTDDSAPRDLVIDEAVAVAGGPEAFARMCGTTVSEVRSWRSVPSPLVTVVEAATGIAPGRLRPDLYPPEEMGADRMVA